MNSTPTASEMLAAMMTGLRSHGEHTFLDKGPEAVMNIYALGVRLERATTGQAASALRSFAHSGPDEDFRLNFSLRAASSIVVGLQDWEPLFEEHGIADILNVKMPSLQPGDSPALEGDSKRASKPRLR